MLNKIEEGSGISITIMLKGKPTVFDLAVHIDKRYGGNDFVYCFLNKSTLQYFRSPYSGGNTGCGTNAYDIMSGLEHQFITDMKEIQMIAVHQKNKAAADEAAFKAKRKAQVELINKLPKKAKIGDDRLDTFYEFTRSKAEYNPSYSRKIMGGTWTLEEKDSKRGVWLDRYLTADGKCLRKQFARKMKYDFQKVEHQIDSNQLLDLLLAKRTELTKMVTDISKNNA